jgi:HEAT repeat protein
MVRLAWAATLTFLLAIAACDRERRFEGRDAREWATLLDAADPDVRFRSVSAIGLLGDAHPAIVSRVSLSLGDSDEGVSGMAVNVLLELAGSSPSGARSVTRSASMRLALSANANERTLAAHVLGAQGLDAARESPVLTRALDDASPQVRVAAASALAKIGALSAIAALHRVALNDPSEDVRAEAVEAIVGIDPRHGRTMETIRRLLHDSSPLVRERAVYALASCGSAAPSGVAWLPDLIAALSDSAPSVRAAVAESLRLLGPRAVAAIPRLRNALDDESAHVRARARAALDAIHP